MQDNFPEYIIVHHTGGTQTDPLADTSHHTLEIVDAYHKSLGWESIGYHWFIEKDGKTRAGRMETHHGAHTKGYNEKSIGVCFAGNFDLTLPTQEQINAGQKLITEIRERYKIPLDKIVPHRKFASKTCYGSKLPDTWGRSLVQTTFKKETVLAMLDNFRDEIENL